VILNIYDNLERKAEEVINSFQGKGDHQVCQSVGHLQDGIFLVRPETGGSFAAGKPVRYRNNE
jgi:hypothetical protein